MEGQPEWECGVGGRSARFAMPVRTKEIVFAINIRITNENELRVIIS